MNKTLIKAFLSIVALILLIVQSIDTSEGGRDQCPLKQDTYTGVFDEGFFEFQYTPDYQYVSVSASSKGQVQTKHERFEDGRWRSDPYSLAHTLGIGAGWSTGDEGGSIIRTKSGYSFTYRHTETERKENSEFGTITTITTTTLNGVIKPFSKR